MIPPPPLPEEAAEEKPSLKDRIIGLLPEPLREIIPLPELEKTGAKSAERMAISVEEMPQASSKLVGEAGNLFTSVGRIRDGINDLRKDVSGLNKKVTKASHKGRDC